MRITEQLNIEIPLYDSDDKIYAYVHSVPLSREVFAANYLILAKTFAATYREGLGEMVGPRVAMYTMKQVAGLMSDDPDSIVDPVINEIRRLTHVIAATPNGWDTMLLHDALNRKMLDEADADEVMNSLVFFTCASAIMPHRKLREILPGAIMLWGGQISSQGVTALFDSLPKLTGIVSSGVTERPDFQPISSLAS